MASEVLYHVVDRQNPDGEHGISRAAPPTTLLPGVAAAETSHSKTTKRQGSAP